MISHRGNVQHLVDRQRTVVTPPAPVKEELPPIGFASRTEDMQQRWWTKQEREELRQMVSDGSDYDGIARAIARSTNAVKVMASKIGARRKA